VTNPRLILADEPTGALDTKTGGEIMELFQTLNREGITIVLITHSEEVAQIASRVIRIRDGNII
jgi:putative ABC transport system ATP-binding protein